MGALNPKDEALLGAGFGVTAQVTHANAMEADPSSEKQRVC